MKRYEKVNIEAIKVYAGNAKIHPQRQIDQLRASIREFGFITPFMDLETYNKWRKEAYGKDGLLPIEKTNRMTYEEAIEAIEMRRLTDDPDRGRREKDEMTREEYMGELERFAFFYKEMRRISGRIKGETNYAYPIGVELIGNGLAIHLDGSISILPRMDFVKGDMYGGYREHKAEHNGVKFFYLDLEDEE